MKIISPDSFPQWNKEGLRSFLTTCQSESQADGHLKLASISLEVKHIDPLAVLESIYEPNELHFYCEHAHLDMAIAGAEAVLEETFSGPSRFQAARAFSESILEHTIAIGDLSLPFSGPHFFAGFTFFDEAEKEEAPFKPATVFLPRWQVSRHNGVYCAVANIPVTPDAPIDLLVEKVWAAHEKFSAFDYVSVPPHEAPPVKPDSLTEVGGEDWFVPAVENALGKIKAGEFEKVVLARAFDLESEQAFQPLDALNNLRETYPACYGFSMANGAEDSFIGATPERLLRVQSNTVFTEAIAGSAPRGATAREDAEFARELLRSDKDHREHHFVIDSISRRLAGLGIELDRSAQSRLIKLPNVQHLKTPLQGILPEKVHVLDVLAELHPTPAVGGMPREAACAEIAATEPFERGLYAGALGWFNYKNEGEFVVGIRSAFIRQKRARLFAGVGIVEGSQPAREKQETDWKLRALLTTLQK